jgi:hypothetical protein
MTTKATDGTARCPLLALSGHPQLSTCLLSRSLLGVKRTYPFALHMSANDPKRTLSLFASVSPKFCPPFVVYEVGTGASVHHA